MTEHARSLSSPGEGQLNSTTVDISRSIDSLSEKRGHPDPPHQTSGVGLSESDEESDESMSPGSTRSNSSMELFRSKVMDPFIETYSTMIEQKEAMKRRFQGLMAPNTEPRYYSHPFRYDSHNEAWTVIPFQTLTERKFKGHHLRSLRLLTYNIWFREDENFDGMSFSEKRSAFYVPAPPF